MIIRRFKVGDTVSIAGVLLKVVSTRGGRVELGVVSPSGVELELTPPDSAPKSPGSCTPAQKP